MPTDYLAGTNFKIAKTSNGSYADYSTSSWARKETALTEDQLAAIDEYGLNTLSDFLPAKPSQTEVGIIAEMFEASVDGELYDPDRFAEYFRPWGMDKPASDSTSDATVVPQRQASKEAESSEVPDKADKKEELASAEPAKESTAKESTANESSANDKHAAILAMIKNRQS